MDNPFIPKEYYEMRERISKRFEDRLFELALHERITQKWVETAKN